jgi:hypothetical protein
VDWERGRGGEEEGKGGREEGLDVSIYEMFSN